MTEFLEDGTRKPFTSDTLLSLIKKYGIKTSLKKAQLFYIKALQAVQEEIMVSTSLYNIQTGIELNIKVLKDDEGNEALEVDKLYAPTPKELLKYIRKLSGEDVESMIDNSAYVSEAFDKFNDLLCVVKDSMNNPDKYEAFEASFNGKKVYILGLKTERVESMFI